MPSLPQSQQIGSADSAAHGAHFHRSPFATTEVCANGNPGPAASSSSGTSGRAATHEADELARFGAALLTTMRDVERMPQAGPLWAGDEFEVFHRNHL